MKMNQELEVGGFIGEEAATYSRRLMRLPALPDAGDGHEPTEKAPCTGKERAVSLALRSHFGSGFDMPFHGPFLVLSSRPAELKIRSCCYSKYGTRAELS